MQLEDLNIVLKVAQFRNITAAAESLDMHTATASAALKRVEKALGAELFIRSTRKLRLSTAGEKYIPQCEQALALLNQARQEMKDQPGLIEGELRIAISSDLGRNIILPWLDEFMDANPKISLKLHLSDSTIDFYRDPVDIALRYGSPTDSNLYGYIICPVPRCLCASQAYLDKYGTPQHPQDLVTHNGLFYQLHDIVHDVWTFTDGKQQYKIKVNGNRTSNDGDLVRRWCVSGKGIATKSCLDMSGDLLSGNVVNVMPEFQPKPTDLWLICPSRQSITPAVRLLRDFLKEQSADVLNKLASKGLIP